MAGEPLSHWLMHMMPLERLEYHPSDETEPATWNCIDPLKNKYSVSWKPYSRIPFPNILKEVSALGNLKHENIVRLLDVKVTDEGAYLKWENLHDNLGDKAFGRMYSPKLFKSDIQQLLQGIAHCHAHHYIHGNLTPEGLQIGLTDKLKITDFGYAVMEENGPVESYPPYDEELTSIYKAPELLLGMPYSSAVDIWAIGVIFGGLIVGTPVFNGTTSTDVAAKIFATLGFPSEAQMSGICSAWVRKCESQHIPVPLLGQPKTFQQHLEELEAESLNGIDPLAIDLLSRMVIVAPSLRISASDALQHPYLKHDEATSPSHVASSSSHVASSRLSLT